MYFPFFSLRHGGKRPAAQPQTIDSEFPNILQIRARGSRGSGNTGLTIFSSFFFLRLHSFLRPLPFFGFLLAVDGSLALGLLPGWFGCSGKGSPASATAASQLPKRV